MSPRVLAKSKDSYNSSMTWPRWFETCGDDIGHNVSWCLLPRPRTLQSGQILCFGALASTHGRWRRWRTPRIIKNPNFNSGWIWMIWAQRETPNSCFYMFSYMFSCHVFSDFKDKLGDMPFEDLPSVPGLGPPCVRSDGPGNPEKNDGLWGYVAMFHFFGHIWGNDGHIWPYHIWGCSMFFSDMAIFFGKNAAPGNKSLSASVQIIIAELKHPPTRFSIPSNEISSHD